jgi:hypothetical protein
VNGNVSNLHAVPVAGVAAGNPEYLTGDYNSKLTTQLSMAGNYFSTGGTSANDGTHDTITISFTTAQTSFTLLWGSIDTGNLLTFYETNGTQFVVTGAQVQAAAAGFISNGYQGPGGSAYVIVDTTVGFSKVVATSSNVSFEFAGVAANTTNFVPGTAPEPSSFGLIGLAAGLAGLFVWRRTRTRAYPPNAKARP